MFSEIVTLCELQYSSIQQDIPNQQDSDNQQNPLEQHDGTQEQEVEPIWSEGDIDELARLLLPGSRP